MSDQASRTTTSSSPGAAIGIATAAFGCGFLAIAYLAGVVDGMTGWFVCVGAAIVTGAATFFGLQAGLSSIAQGTRQSDAFADDPPLAALTAVVAVPHQAQRWFAGIGAATSVLAAFSFGAGTSLSIMLALTGMALASAVAAGLFYAMKLSVQPQREQLALAIALPAERAKVLSRLPLAWKAGIALGTSSALAASVGVTLSLSHAQHAQQAWVDDVQARTLAAVVDASDAVSFDAAVEQVVGLSRARAFESTIEQVELGATATSVLGPESVTRVADALERGDAVGHFDAPETGARVSFHRMGQDEVAVAIVPRRVASLPGMSLLSWGLIALVAGLSAWWLARSFSADVREAVATLSRVTDRMSRGDLRRQHVWESEDELGQLWRSHEEMGHAFRETVKNLADAADRVDAAAAEIQGVSADVSGASAEQVRRIQQASELMVSINSQVMEVAGSAQELNIAVEESSSSILELGAAGDELNETASVLGSKVDEVSGSIEQMVRSVKQVSSNSDGLADAAAETSASMEEMASAMRAVDTTAEATAELSRGVVVSAESGQQKVSQTIDGMEAIRDATDTAENVIRGLGARTQEIGAILDVIDDVAEETNLLALNAAIIAAQAGEHGRAFSVVADEIKELADRVLASTKEIGGLIKSVQDESDNAVGAIEVGSRSVGNGVELSAEAGLSLEEITRSSRESGQRIGEIVSAVREQTKAASHVVALMDTVRDGVTAIVSAAADQDRGNEVVYRSSVTMRDVTQQVRRTTEEQSRGFVRIRESIEGVREVVENINGSLQEQTTACGQVAQFLEQVFERTRSNEEAADSMSESVHGLIAQADVLRENVKRFQV